MKNNLSVIELRILLSFLTYDDYRCKVSDLARTLNEKVYTISRILKTLRNKDIIEADENNKPNLSTKGIKLAKYYEERITVIINHMLKEGVNFSTAKEDALLSALFLSDESINAICKYEEIYHMKNKLSDYLKEKGVISVNDIINNINEGTYSISFVFYKLELTCGCNLSLLNTFFENPCNLIIRNKSAFIQLKVKNDEKNITNYKFIKGKIKMLEYFTGGRFIHCEKTADIVSIPLDVFNLKLMGSEDKKFIHGSLKVKSTLCATINAKPITEALLSIQI